MSQLDQRVPLQQLLSYLLTNMSTEIEKLKEEQDRLSTSVNSHKQELEEIEKKEVVALNRLSAAQKRAEVAEETLSKLGTQAESEFVRIQELRKEEGEASANLKKLQDSFVTTTKELGMLEKEIATKKEDMRKDFADIQNTQLSQKQALEREIEKLKVQADDLRAQTKALSDAVESENEALETVKKEIAKLESGKNVIFQEISNAEGVKLNLEKEVDGCKEKVDSLNLDIKKLEENKKKIEEDIKKLESEKLTAQAEVDALIKDKVNFAEAKRQFTQREDNIREIYQKAGITYPEISV